MATVTKTGSFTSGGDTYDVTVTGTSQGIQYNHVPAEAINQFNFLKVELPNKLQEAYDHFNIASQKVAFDVIGASGSVVDLSDARTELDNDIKTLKQNMEALYNHISSEITAINTEIDSNYSWVTGVHIDIDRDKQEATP